MREERGESLEAFGIAIGVASKGRVSEIERGLRPITAQQALAIERLSGGRVDAGLLNSTVAAVRAAGTPDASACGEADRVIICAACDEPAPDPAVRACGNLDCPHVPIVQSGETEPAPLRKRQKKAA